ncbi:MAG: COX15/CtaA family protein [Bdellovibrionota bacterium]
MWMLRKEQRKWLRITALAALAAVILQGILGGMTVLYKLPVAISSFHAVLAQSFLCLTIFIAYALSQEFIERKKSNLGNSKIFNASLLATGLVFIQLIIGAVMRHSGSGLAVLDFPTMGGEWLPSFSAEMLEALNTTRANAKLYPITVSHAAIHIAHRAFGVIVLAAVFNLVLVVGKSNYKDSKVNKLTGLILVLVAVQFLLGIITVFSLRSPVPTSVHVVCGALLLALLFSLSLISYDLKKHVS